MKNFLILITLIFFPLNLFSNENIEKKAREINKKIRCVVCQSQSIDDSDSKKLEEGKSEKEITNYLVDRYGEFILFKPKFSAKTYILWLSPIFIILFGIFLIKGIFRKS